jgi:N-methylhydantoinase B
MRVDKVTFEIVRNYFTAIVEDAARIIERTAFTTFVTETGDFSCGLISTGGEYVALPWKVGAPPFIGVNMRTAIEFIRDYHDGDITIANDPYTTGGLSTHLPDLHLLKPIFHRGQPVAFAHAFVHSSDIGGAMPASISPRATEIFQEGLRLRPTKLFRAGEINQDVLNILSDNSRIPDLNWGDIKAMVAGLNTIERRFGAMVEKFGFETVAQSMVDLLDHVEARTVAVLQTIPNGEYRFVDYLEDDMVSEVPVRISLAMTARNGRIHLDYSGTDPQVAAALNVPSNGVAHPHLALGLIAYILSEDPDLPKAGSILRPVRVTAPQGTIVNSVFPAATGVRFGTVLRLADIVLGALVQAVPGRVPAAPAGASSPIVCSLMNPRTGRRHVTVVQPMQAAGGARADGDGLHARDPISGHIRNTPVESLEADIPIVVRRYHLVPDSGGPGTYRGGMSVRLDFQVFHPGALVMARGMERFKIQPWGVAGGRCGATGEVILNPDTPNAKPIGRFDRLMLEPHDIVSFRWPAGAGYGAPFERDPQAVAVDVRAELVSEPAAREQYGVVLHNGAVDGRATCELRAHRSAAGRPIEMFDYGDYRRALERRWPQEVAAELARLLDDLPIAVRDYVKHEVFHALAEVACQRVPVTADLHDVWQTVVARLQRALL